MSSPLNRGWRTAFPCVISSNPRPTWQKPAGAECAAFYINVDYRPGCFIAGTFSGKGPIIVLHYVTCSHPSVTTGERGFQLESYNNMAVPYPSLRPPISESYYLMDVPLPSHNSIFNRGLARFPKAQSQRADTCTALCYLLAPSVTAGAP